MILFDVKFRILTHYHQQTSNNINFYLSQTKKINVFYKSLQSNRNFYLHFPLQYTNQSSLQFSIVTNIVKNSNSKTKLKDNYKEMSNQDKIRLIDCFFQPCQVFDLYDYTKIIYPIDGYICMREISTPETQPTFIKLQHEYDKIHSIFAFPNLIITLQENHAKQFSLGFYDSMHFHTKLNSSLAEQFKKFSTSQKNDYMTSKKLDVKVKKSSEFIFILFSLKNESPFNPINELNKMLRKDQSIIHPSQYQQPNDNEMIILNIKSKRVISRCYFPSNVNQLVIKQNSDFTLLQDDSTLSEYYLSQSLKSHQGLQSFTITKRRDIDFVHINSKSRDRIEKHVWVKEQLIVVNSSRQEINVFIDNKKAQTISLDNIKNVNLLCGLMCGFIVCNENSMFVYKKVQLDYVCIAEFFITEVGFSPELILSPQQDIVAYFVNSRKGIHFIRSFNDEVEAQTHVQKKLAKELKSSGSIEFKRNHGLRVDVNKRNNTFAVSHRSTLQLYTINNFELYLEESIQSENFRTGSPSKSNVKRMNTVGAVQGYIQNMSKQQTILRVAIHPFSQILAIAIKSKVRIYQILYNELSHIKDISVSNCSEMFFSNSGQFLSIVVSGKNGSKCYVYKANEDYDPMDCLSIGKKIERFIWNKHDSFLYGIHNSGYYRWSIESSLKNRFQTLFDIPFQVIDAILNNRKDIVVLYGQKEILKINEKMDKQNELNPKDIIKVSKTIKQIVYQNGSYFINFIDKKPEYSCEKILKCEDLQNLQFMIQEFFQLGTISKSPPTYFESNDQNHAYTMIPCSGDSRKNFILLVEDQTKNIKVLEWGKTSGQDTKGKKVSDLIKIDRKNLKKLFKKHIKYEEQVKALQENLHQTLDKIREDLAERQKQRQQSFIRELKSAEQRYQQIKLQKQKLEHSIEQKIQLHEQRTIKEVKQLEKIYERKIAITTNKLLTSQEMNYRNMLLAQENLKKLEAQTDNDIEKIRGEYKKQLAKYMSEKDVLAEEILQMKKLYECKLYDLEQENQRILEKYQSKSEDSIQALNINLVSKDIKLSQTLSKKDNLEKTLQQELVTIQILKEKIEFLEAKNREANKKSEYLLIDIEKYEKILQQKNSSISIYEQRINDLEKSNEILKYRVVQLKGQTEPQSQENQKLKDNLNELQAQYDKIVKSAFQKEQMLSIVKKQSEKSRQTIYKLESKVKKIEKSYLDLLDKVMNITKAPIQQIRKQLINLLNTTKQDEKHLNRPMNSSTSNQSPLGELNRIREHLQICLHQAIDSGKKGEQQKKVELMKKNRQNSELIKEINDLRRKIRQFEGIVKEKDIQINRLMRGDPIAVNEIKPRTQKQNARQNSTEGNAEENQTELVSLNNFQTNERLPSQVQTRKHTRETKESFFERSMFKSGSHWREKRLRTEHTQYRHAHTRSLKRNPSGKYLQIESKGGYDDIDDLKRVIDQKQTIIKQLINKIQSLS